jgi:hypothetical protein
VLPQEGERLPSARPLSRRGVHKVGPERHNKLSDDRWSMKIL